MAVILYKKDTGIYYENGATKIFGDNVRVLIQGVSATEVYVTVYLEKGYKTNKNLANDVLLIADIKDILGNSYGTTFEELIFGYNKGFDIKIQNEEGEYIDVQNPFPTDGDSVYAKDIDSEEIIDTGWTPVNGGITEDLFGEVDVGIAYIGTDNPKVVTIPFHRAVITTGGMGLVTTEGSFSNVKLIAVQANGTETVLVDFSSIDADFTILPLQFSPTGFNALRFEFHTTDDVTITNIFIPKASTVIARIQGKSSLTGFIETISSYREALNVNSAWVHRKIVNDTYHQDTANTTNPSIGITAGDISITVDDATGFITGDEIKLEETVDGVGIQEIGIMTLTDVTGSVLTLDRPVGFDYTTAAIVTEVITNMAVDGTLANPQIFEIDPPVGTIWQFTRVMPSLVHIAAADDGKFGGIAALTNGVCLRATTAAGRTVVFANWKTNADMKLDMFNVIYSDKAPAGNHGTNGRWTFTNAEVVAELDGDASPIQKLEVLIQDPLSTMISFYLRGQGRVFSP